MSSHPISAQVFREDRRSALPRRGVLALLIMMLVFGFQLFAPRSAHAAASDYCSGEFLAVGANWSVCWEVRANEGLAITHAFYTNPSTGFDRRVLSDATVAQIFVPYETGTPRYHDVAYGLGPAMQRLSPALDCPHGRLLAGGRVCREVADRGIAQKFCNQGNCATRRGKALELWSSIQAGAYNYLLLWSFHDDGTIEPAIGLTGALQFGDTDHTHNVYWRMDFDLGDAENDRVEEFTRLPRPGSDGLQGVSTWSPLLGEQFKMFEPFSFRKWRVVDTAGTNSAGRPWSYEINPSPQDGNLRTNNSEGFSKGEFWVTKARSSERFVSTDEADLLSGYLNGENVNGEDVVVWYVMHEYHEVRSEDAPYMPNVWMRFHATPRDFFDRNPLN